MSVGLTRVFIDCDNTLDLGQRTLLDYFSRFVTQWYKQGVEVVALTRGSVDKTEKALVAAELRRYFEEVRSLSEPKVFNSVGDLLYEGLKQHGWVPREQLYIDVSVPSMLSVWQEGTGALRRINMAHTVRLPAVLTVDNATDLLQIVADRITMPPARGTTHVTAVKYNGVFSVDEEDSIAKLQVDQAMGEAAKREALAQLSASQQEAITVGRPDLVKLLHGEAAAAAVVAERKNAPSARAASPEPQSKSFMGTTTTNATTATSATKATPPLSSAAKATAAAKPTTPVRTMTLQEVSEGMRVMICTGPQEGCVGIVLKVAGQGSGGEVRYRVKLDNSESTSWTTKVKGVFDGAGGTGPSVGNGDAGAGGGAPVVSPLMAALNGGSPSAKGKAGGKGSPKAPPPAAKPKVEEVEPFPEGTLVEVLSGPVAGKCGTVLKITGEAKEKKYRVEIEAGGGSKWCEKVKLAQRALQKEEVVPKITDFYDVEKKKLGTGAFGSVSKCVNRATKLVRAMKTCLKPLVKNVEAIWKEVAVMKRLDHPNIIKLYDTFEDARSVYLIMELCSGGELFDRISEQGRFEEKDAAVVMQHIFRGVHYMHSRRITHRDLKPENFLLTSGGKAEAVSKSSLKIIDFGLAHDFPEEGTMLRTKAGSAYYVSPQVLNASYDHMADMWSLGVINYILLCGRAPFEADTDPEIFSKVKTGEYTFDPENWNHISKDAKDLIDCLLTFDPTQRMTADTALRSAWISDLAPRAQLGRSGSMIDNLKSFQSANHFKKAALQVVATEMNDNQIKALRDTFLALDTNGDGLLSAQELREGMAKIGVNELPADVARLLETVDANNSGSIDYTEFLSASMDKKMYIQEDVCWAVFRSFDKDGNGKISKEEIAEVLKDRDVRGVAPADISLIMSQIDSDGDGELDFQEFMKMMRGH